MSTRLPACRLPLLLLTLCACLWAAPVHAHPLQVEPVIITIYPQQTFLSAIITGNIQIAQVIICCCVFPLLMLWRRGVDKRAKYGGLGWLTMIRLASAWVVFAGGSWLVQRKIG